MAYIQSFYQYPITFSNVGVTIPCLKASGQLRNIIEVSDEQVSLLKEKEPLFNTLLARKKIRVLDKLPASYVPANQQINDAHKKAKELQEENAKLLSRIKELEKDKAETANATKKKSTKAESVGTKTE